MKRSVTAVLLACVAVAGCNESSSSSKANEPHIRVVSEEQQQLHQLDALDLAVGLKRAIYDAGFTCKRITDAGYVSSGITGSFPAATPVVDFLYGRY